MRGPRQEFVAEVSQIVRMRLLWALLPASRALKLDRADRLAEIVTWALARVDEDIAATLERYEVSALKEDR
jgi:hypothetical protein